MKKSYSYLLFLSINIFLLDFSAANHDKQHFQVNFPDRIEYISIHSISNLTLSANSPLQEPLQLQIAFTDSKVLSILSRKDSNITLTLQNSSRMIDFEVVHPGTTFLQVAETSQPEIPLRFFRMAVVYSISLDTFCSIIGWVYFVCWSTSFYPQVVLNFQRKSVVGLNFDFLMFNLLGFIGYSVFNCGLFWNTNIQLEYRKRHPGGVLPVLANDVFFGLHAVLLTLCAVLQCFIYEKGSQKLSYLASALTLLLCVVLLSSFFASYFHLIEWLDFLYTCSYIKLAINLVKYVPQALMNHRRKSTQGWSIGNILLDFTGGILSILQMVLIAANHDDFDSLTGNPVKIGLSLCSIIFDVVFLLQHYVFYRNSRESTEYKVVSDTLTTPANHPEEDFNEETHLRG